MRSRRRPSNTRRRASPSGRSRTSCTYPRRRSHGSSPEASAAAILGIAINGIPLAALMSEELGKELIIYRPSQERHGKGGAFSSNYAAPQGKKVIIVDDVVSTGETIKAAISDLHEIGGTPVLALTLVNKTGHDEMAGVPLRALIRARSI